MENFVEKWLFTYWQIGKRYFFLAALMFVLFYIVFKSPMLNRRIQNKSPQYSDYYRDVFNSIISIGIFAGISVWTFWIIRPYTNLYKNISDYSMWYFAFTFVWMFFLHDFYFYVSHRLMHHPKLFKLVHLTHHKSNNPSPRVARNSPRGNTPAKASCARDAPLPLGDGIVGSRSTSCVA